MNFKTNPSDFFDETKSAEILDRNSALTSRICPLNEQMMACVRREPEVTTIGSNFESRRNVTSGFFNPLSYKCKNKLLFLRDLTSEL